MKMNRLNNLHLARLEYNEELSCDIVKCSIVDLYARCAQGTTSILRLLKGTLDIDGSLICAEGQVRITQQIAYTPPPNLGGYLPAPSSNSLECQPGCMPMVVAQTPPIYGNNEQIITSAPGLQAKFPFLRLARYSIGDSSDVNGSFTEEDRACGRYLYGKLKQEEWSYCDGNASWKRAFIDLREPGDAGATLIDYRNSNNIFDHRAEFLFLDGQLVFLPLAYYQHPQALQPLRLYIPPDKPIFFNENMLSFYPDATVILTDNPGLIWNNQATHELIVLGIFGGDDKIEKIDLEVLRGRRIVWPILDDGISDLKKLYRRAVRLKERFRKAEISLAIAIYSDMRWYTTQAWMSGISYPLGYANSFRILDDTTFIKQAQELGIFIPECLRYDRFGAIDLTRVLEPKELIPKLVSGGTVTIINEYIRVRPFRISHAVLNGAINGEDIFGEKLQNTQRMRLILFLSHGTEQRFMRECRRPVSEAWTLYRFPQASPEETLRQIKGALAEFPSDIVIFEAEEIASKGQTARDAIRLCIQDRRGVIVVCHQIEKNKAGPAWLESEADRVLNVMPLPENGESYVIENRLFGSAKPERFKVEFNEDGVKALDVTDEELMTIENRPLYDNSESNTNELKDFFSSASSESLLEATNN